MCRPEVLSGETGETSRPAGTASWLRARIGAVSRGLLIAPVRLYQMTLSPLIPFGCRFEPTCSHYFIEAVKTHGALRGGWMGVWRVLRCQPLCRGGYDPVPGASGKAEDPAGGAGSDGVPDDL